MSHVIKISWEDVKVAAAHCADRNKGLGLKSVWGIPSGGSVVAPFVAHHMALPVVAFPDRWSLAVDDLVDSGGTIARSRKAGLQCHVDALFRKPAAPLDLAVGAIEKEGWLHFPWEQEARPEDAVVRLLQYLGEDVTRDGLKGTPARVLKAMAEMTEGMYQNPAEILERQFDLPYDEMVMLKHIPFTSMCEHHMLPFTGTATVAYIPDGKKVVGLSKLARLVLCFAKRLQIQERMADQIVTSLMEHLQPSGAACIIKAEHSCMACRGVRLPGTEFVTSALRGVFRNDLSARAELMSLISG
jgi:GTP cyclohydrolase I